MGKCRSHTWSWEPRARRIRNNNTSDTVFTPLLKAHLTDTYHGLPCTVSSPCVLPWALKARRNQCTPRYTSTQYNWRNLVHSVQCTSMCTKTECAQGCVHQELVCTVGQAGAHWAPLGQRSPWIGQLLLLPILLLPPALLRSRRPPLLCMHGSKSAL